MSKSSPLQPISSVFRTFPAALALVWICFSGSAALAGPLGELEADELAVVESLALYDEALRRDALEAAGEADVLGALVAQQERSSATFRQLLEPYDRQVQEDLYELARYPDLVSEIVAGGPKTQAQLENIAARYPTEASTAAGRSAHENWKVVARTDALLRDETTSFEASIAHLPEGKQRAFRSLVASPDLLALLSENTGVAVLLGDAYDREPEATLAWLEEVEQDVSKAGQRETRELTEALEQDEELADQITASTAAYRSETGVSAYAVPAATRSSVVVSISPFPFWIGQPWWYASTYSYYDPWYYWYPRYAWSFGGSYFGPRFYASFGFGWPHSAFWGWYFRSPRHHAYYPRLTHHVVSHYDRYSRHRYRNVARGDWRRHHSRYSRPGRHAVNRFVRDAEGSMPRGFMRNDRRRVERFREFGRLHEDGGRARSERNARRTDLRRNGRDTLLQRARADGTRYPRLATLSRDPERSPRADRRERAEKRDRRGRNPQREGRDNRSVTRERERRGGSNRDAGAIKGAGGAVRDSEPRSERRQRSARVDRKRDGRREARNRKVEPRAERRRASRRVDPPNVERRRESKRVDPPNVERRRESKRVDPPRTERRRDSGSVEQPRAERPRDAQRAERSRKERRRDAAPEASPRRERAEKPRGEARNRNPSPRAERRSAPRAERRADKPAFRARNEMRQRGQAGGGRRDGGGQRGGGGGKGGRGRGGR